jgi:hypothetical protein
LRAVPVDVIAIIAIAAVILVTHVRIVRHGVPFNDSAWFFHFGRRILHGDTPYRDFVFQAGPLPLYVDAAFQRLFGPHYPSSLYAGLFIKILRVWVMWLLVRRIAGWRVAALIAVFCAFDPSFAFAHHWSTSWASLFTILCTLFLVLATRTDRLDYLALAGLCAALISFARQSCGAMTWLVLFGATTAMALRGEFFTRRRYLALWGGFAAGIAVMALALIAVGALGPAIQQMFIDGAEKKGVSGFAAVLDAVSGGALTDYGHTWWGGLLLFLGVPALVIGALFALVSRDRPVSTNTLGLLVLPVMLIYGLLTRYGVMFVTADLPRTCFEVTTAIAIVWPDRIRAWFGLEPIEAIALGAVPMASDWAMELSFPGRGWGDGTALVIGMLLFTLASRRLPERAKRWIAGALAVTALVHVGWYRVQHRNPFALHDAEDGTLRENRFNLRNPIFRGMKVNESRQKVVTWLTEQVRPHSTCFVYANLPILYDILDCTNPTRLDSTIGDYPSYADGVEAAERLRAHPPDYIVAHDAFWTMPAISVDTGGKLENYGGLWNMRAIREVHMALRSIIDQYETVGLAKDVLGPALTEQAHGPGHWDSLDGLHLYRRVAPRAAAAPAANQP